MTGPVFEPGVGTYVILPVLNPNPFPAKREIEVTTYLAWDSVKMGRLQGVGNGGPIYGQGKNVFEFQANERKELKIYLESTDDGDESVVNPALKTLQFTEAGEVRVVIPALVPKICT